MKQATLDKRLLKAAQNGEIEECKALLLRGANPSAPVTMYRETVLHSLAWQGNFEIFRLLIDHGADIEAKTMYDQTPLFVAAHRGRAEECQFLIERGANIDATDHNGQTPLYNAADRGCTDVCRLLVAHGANPHAIDKYRKKPIHSAILSKSAETMRYFLEECGEAGSISDAQPDGRTFEEYATDLVRPESAAFLGIYRNSLKTVEAIADAMSATNEAARSGRPRGLSPL